MQIPHSRREAAKFKSSTVEEDMVEDAKRYRVLSLLKEALEVLESEPEVEF
jgi:hypothetical protein